MSVTEQAHPAEPKEEVGPSGHDERPMAAR